MTFKIDSGTYGTVYKVGDENNKLSAIKIFESTSNTFTKFYKFFTNRRYMR